MLLTDILEGVGTLAGVLVTGAAGVGAARVWRGSTAQTQSESWKELAESRKERIEELERQIVDHQHQIELLKVASAEQDDKIRKLTELVSSRAAVEKLSERIGAVEDVAGQILGRLVNIDTSLTGGKP